MYLRHYTFDEIKCVTYFFNSSLLWALWCIISTGGPQIVWIKGQIRIALFKFCTKRRTGYFILTTQFWMLCSLQFEICRYFSTRCWAELFWFENGGKFQTHGLEHKKSCCWNKLTSTSNSKVHFLSKNWDFHLKNSQYWEI